jgi:hypothetical protein
MTGIPPLRIIALSALLAGCAHERRYVVLPEQELAGCKQAALDAASSADAWRRFRAERLTEGSFKVDVTRIEYHLDFHHCDRITVILPTDQHFGMHSCFIEVSVVHESSEVADMRESFWP